mmetsp:Transcript_1268/g.2962  ORF Transcript_1268/g.2962 Transcript_1268/m.2962 type:complete len:213 (-) Transcript_1268:691-1329(-)
MDQPADAQYAPRQLDRPSCSSPSALPQHQGPWSSWSLLATSPISSTAPPTPLRPSSAHPALAATPPATNYLLGGARQTRPRTGPRRQTTAGKAHRLWHCSRTIALHRACLLQPLCVPNGGTFPEPAHGQPQENQNGQIACQPSLQVTAPNNRCVPCLWCAVRLGHSPRWPIDHGRRDDGPPVPASHHQASLPNGQLSSELGRSCAGAPRQSR